MIIPVILAGGVGNRLWPVSRESYPKQYLNIFSSPESLLQQTLKRVLALGLDSKPIVVCNNRHRFLIAQQLAQLNISADIILEPTARNTAPAIAAAAFYAQSLAPNATLLVLPADHLIHDTHAFAQALNLAFAQAKRQHLVTLGVQPSYPEPGYGYIEAQKTHRTAAKITAFHEKPSRAEATHYLATGGYYWNSGMFIFTVNTLLTQLQHWQPLIYRQVKQAVAQQQKDVDFIRIDEQAFSQCPAISIDKAIMELTADGMVIPYSGDWSDVGSWNAVYEAEHKDHRANVIQGDVICKDVSGCLIRSQSRLVAAVGVKNLAIIETADALLVIDRDKTQQTKAIVGELQARGRTESC